MQSSFLGWKLRLTLQRLEARYKYLPNIIPECEDQLRPIVDPNLADLSSLSNAKITLLFEKQLSSSDVVRIGRLVLPKRCTENDKRERVVKASHDITINSKKVIFQLADLTRELMRLAIGRISDGELEYAQKICRIMQEIYGELTLVAPKMDDTSDMKSKMDVML
uniref:Translin-associated protein X n=1 Tax=Tanacetum cinerariifolium TaxID=118510 RepID=A0A6L2M6S5_TANCI|nr:translin-associated protein X [Tanacetum cinerariifolium]